MAAHPYLPADLELPHYVANTLSMTYILAVFFGAVAAVLVACQLLSSRFKLRGLGDKGLFFWFVSSGLIHLILEGYFGWNNRIIAGDDAFLGQLWKEYAKADSRYVSSDPFTVTMESTTAFVEGPMCLAVAYAIASRSSWRFPLQIIVSVGQLYGCILYFAIVWFGDTEYGPHGDPIYYWFYFIFMNAIWVVIPFFCILQGYNCCSEALASVGKAARKKRQQ